jgi:hypothetical protein
MADVARVADRYLLGLTLEELAAGVVEQAMTGPQQDR